MLGLRAVLEELLAPVTKYSTTKNEKNLPSGVILFDRAFEIFSSYGNSISKQEFRDEILSAETGLGVLIYSYQTERRFIVLNNEKLDICELLKVIHEEEEWEDVVPEELDSVLTAQDLSSALESMETEYDGWIAKLLVCTGKSRSEIYDLGLKPDRVVKLLREVKARIAASENTTVAANDMENLGTRGSKPNLSNRLMKQRKLSSRYAESGQMLVLGISRKRSLHSKNHMRELLQRWSAKLNKRKNDSIKLSRELLIALLPNKE